MERESLKGERRHNRIAFNSSTVKMGEKLYVIIPALDSMLSVVPKTTNLIYNFKNSNAKSWPLNNLGKLFIQGLQVKLGRDVVYDNTGESVYRIYEDLWKSQQERNAMVGVGITSLETRKTLAGDDGANNSFIYKNELFQNGQSFRLTLLYGLWSISKWSKFPTHVVVRSLVYFKTGYLKMGHFGPDMQIYKNGLFRFWSILTLTCRFTKMGYFDFGPFWP